MTDEKHEAIKRVLHDSQTPKSMPQIRKDLSGRLRLTSKELAGLLQEMTSAGRIFEWSRRTYWDRDPRHVVPPRILELLDKSPAVTPAKMKAALKLPLQLIHPALEDLVRTGRAYIWQPGKTPLYSRLDPWVAALDMIKSALADGPMTEKDLVGRVRKRLPGYQAKHFRDHVSAADGILEHPRHGKVKTRYGLKPPEPGPYLSKAAQEILLIHRLLSPFHVSLEAIHDALGRELGLEHGKKALMPERPRAERTSREAEPLILEGIHRLQPPGQRRALVSIRELRRSLSLGKRVFDEAVLSLALQRKVALHHHDFPTGLPQDERDELVRDEQGTYYVGIVPREAS
jgi:hypothetical protein